MSDFSGFEQSFALSGVGALAEEAPAWRRPVSDDVQPHEVSFRRLRGAHEIAGILPLRGAIRLSNSTLADASFALREKKEMKSASSARSCASARR